MSYSREERREYMREWRKKNPMSHKTYYSKEYGRRRLLLADHNISLDEYNSMFEGQHGLCAICHSHQSAEKRSFAVDHSHTSGKIRGLLCFSCNISLGHMKDNTQYLMNAIDYLNSRGK